MSTLDQILSEFVDEWSNGRRPRALQYLARVPEGPERDALAERITTWLEVAPTPTYANDVRDEIRGEAAVQRVLAAVAEDAGMWPDVVPRLREHAGLSLRELALAVLERFRLDRRHEARAEAYLGRLERGELAPARVSRRLLDALGDILGASRPALEDAASLGQALRPASAPLFRADGTDERVLRDVVTLSRAAMRPRAAAPLDELDRLFTGGPDA